MTKGGRDAALDAQLAECRELLAEMRGVTKDLRQAVREAKDAFPSLAREMVEKAAEREINKMSAVTAGAIEDAEKAVYRRFDGITNLLLTGSKTGIPRRGKIDIEKVAEQLVAQYGPVSIPGINPYAKGEADG